MPMGALVTNNNLRFAPPGRTWKIKHSKCLKPKGRDLEL